MGSISEFVNYFLKKENQKSITDKIKSQPLSFVVYRLFYHLYPKNGKEESYKPDSLLEVLGILNAVYKSHKRRNPNDLISFILNTLHKELNKENNSDNQNQNLNMTNREQLINASLINFGKSNKSIISGYLNWFEIKESSCQQCGSQFYNLYSFNTFELDILFTYKFKQQQPITILDCLKIHQMAKPQNLFCKSHNNYSKFINTSKIYCTPKLIIFSLNRGELNDELINVPFIIEDKIYLSMLIEAGLSPKNYQLAGIVSVFKDNNNNFKYAAFCKSFLNQQWQYYFNENIQQFNLNQVLELHNNNKYIPCILLYRVMN